MNFVSGKVTSWFLINNKTFDTISMIAHIIHIAIRMMKHSIGIHWNYEWGGRKAAYFTSSLQFFWGRSSHPLENTKFHKFFATYILRNLSFLRGGGLAPCPTHPYYACTMINSACVSVRSKWAKHNIHALHALRNSLSADFYTLHTEHWVVLPILLPLL